MTTLCFVAVVIIGLFSLSTLPIDLYPDIETNTLMVMTSYSGASAADIEQNVTRPLENSLNAVNDLTHITSKSRENILNTAKTSTCSQTTCATSSTW